MVNRLYGICNDGDKIYLEINNQYFEGTIKDNNWEIYLPPLSAAGPTKVIIYSNQYKFETKISVGDVYILSGQSNLEWKMSQCLSQNTLTAINEANSEAVRLLNLQLNSSETPLEDWAGEVKWTGSNPVTVRPFSCLGYQFGKYLNDITGIPIGLVSVAVGGATIGFWESPESINKLRNNGVEFRNEYEAHWQIKSINVAGASLGYNAMIVPALKHNYRGVLWYQGASDVAHMQTYSIMLDEMINYYRQAFDNESLLFGLVEMHRVAGAEYQRMYLNNVFNVAANKDKYSCVVTAHDIGDYHDYHPTDKTELAKRAAEEFAYCFYGVERNKPFLELEKIKQIDENEIELYLLNVGDGLVFTNGLSGLEVSSDGLWYEMPTEYSFSKEYISISSTSPINYVRYGFQKSPTLSESEAVNLKLHASIYNSFDRPLRIFDLKLKKF